MLLYDELESNIMFFGGFYVGSLLWLGIQVHITFGYCMSPYPILLWVQFFELFFYVIY